MLRLLVRVPLEAMRDMQFPLHGAGYLDIAAVDSLLPDAARVWIANSVDVYEGDTKLADAADRRRARRAAVGPVVRELRRRARARDGRWAPRERPSSRGSRR